MNDVRSMRVLAARGETAKAITTLRADLTEYLGSNLRTKSSRQGGEDVLGVYLS